MSKECLWTLREEINKCVYVTWPLCCLVLGQLTQARLFCEEDISTDKMVQPDQAINKPVWHFLDW